jgi:hypothetical protein
MPWTCTAGSEEDLSKAAGEIFAKLKLQWLSKDEKGYGYSDYWHLGHSFDTIIDYFAYVDKTEAADFASIARAAFVRSLGSACWYDDYGWWGIAALKAANSPLFHENDAKAFTTISHICWAAMHDNAPNVWANNMSNPDYAPLQPRFDGGVWNTDWSRPDCCGGKNAPPRLPAKCDKPKQGDNLTGIQNTVTNGLYLVLALRLYQATQDTNFRDAASREYDFLNHWLNDKLPPDISLLLKIQDSRGLYDYALVRERVATYAKDAQVCGYESDLAWSGDQGIIVGGLIDRMIVVPADNNPKSMVFQNAVAILLGVLAVTNRYKKNPGILLPWTHGDGGDPKDYSTGIGVFMRYLLYADQKNENIRTYTRTSAYQALISANTAQALKLKPTATHLTMLTNLLAILVAAIVMSKN